MKMDKDRLLELFHIYYFFEVSRRENSLENAEYNLRKHLDISAYMRYYDANTALQEYKNVMKNVFEILKMFDNDKESEK